MTSYEVRLLSVTHSGLSATLPAVYAVQLLLANTNRKSRLTSGEHLGTLADAFVVVRVLCAEITSGLADATYFPRGACKSCKVNPGTCKGKNKNCNWLGLLIHRSGKFLMVKNSILQNALGTVSALQCLLSTKYFVLE